MNKKVNIFPRGPITEVNPPIRIPVMGVTKDVKDIRRCIIAGARVEEITANGTVTLNIQNYDLDNSNAPTKQIAKPAIPEDKLPVKPVEPTPYTFEHDSKPEGIKQQIERAEQVKEEIKAVEEQIAEEAKQVEEEEAKVEAEAETQKNLTRRQRRALRAAEQLKALESAKTVEETPTEEVVTVDAEEE